MLAWSCILGEGAQEPAEEERVDLHKVLQLPGGGKEPSEKNSASCAAQHLPRVNSASAKQKLTPEKCHFHCQALGQALAPPALLAAPQCHHGALPYPAGRKASTKLLLTACPAVIPTLRAVPQRR